MAQTTESTPNANGCLCSKVLLFALVSAAIVGVSLIAYFVWFGQPASTETQLYSIMFDAGSTGTRMHIFTFEPKTPVGPSLVKAETFKIEPGLSAYAADPPEAAKSLDELLEQALRIVPLSEQAYTPITLKATAGLRLLSEPQQTAILNAVQQRFIDTPFRKHERSVEIIDGDSEGMFSWLSLVSILKKDFHNNSIAALDMGGGSTQLTFLPKDGDTLARTEDIKSILLPDKTSINLYTHSYLGGGLMFSRAELLKQSSVEQNGHYSVNSSCITVLPSTMNWSYLNASFEIHPNDKSSFDECQVLAEAYVKNTLGTFAPKELSSNELYLMSYFYDRPLAAGLLKSGERHKILRVEDFKKVAQLECSPGRIPQSSVYQNEFLCLDLTYFYVLLRTGYGLPENTEVQVVLDLNGVDISWALGAALVELQFRKD